MEEEAAWKKSCTGDQWCYPHVRQPSHVGFGKKRTGPESILEKEQTLDGETLPSLQAAETEEVKHYKMGSPFF